MTTAIDPDVKLFIAMPVYRDVDASTTASLMMLVQRLTVLGIRYQAVSMIGCAVLELARSALAAQFLEGDCTHMLFVDSDMVFEPDVVIRMLASGHDLVGVIYPRRNAGTMMLPAQPTERLIVDQTGCFEVPAIGTGLMLIARTVVERLSATVTERVRLSSDVIVPCLFRTMISERNVIVGEDYSFCLRWVALGGKVHALFNARMGHVGRQELTCNFADRYHQVVDVRQTNGEDRQREHDAWRTEIGRIAAMPLDHEVAQ